MGAPPPPLHPLRGITGAERGGGGGESRRARARESRGTTVQAARAPPGLRADALIRPRFIPISRFDKSICRGERCNFKVARSVATAARRWRRRRGNSSSRLCVSSRGYFKFRTAAEGGARERASIFQRQTVLCDGRCIPRGMSFEDEKLLRRDSSSRNETRSHDATVTRRDATQRSWRASWASFRNRSRGERLRRRVDNFFARSCFGKRAIRVNGEREWI